MNIKHRSVLAFLFVIFQQVQAQVPAFKGAEGAGMYTTGGRGGVVYFVNTLMDEEVGDHKTRSGSLRWCLQQKNARTVVFQVSGTIHLQKALRIVNGDLTLAGQSAPAQGICIADYPVSVDASNVIIRYLRFRMGDLKVTPEEADGADAFSGRQQKNVIIDHCSISWSTDECSSFYDNENFTMQWCIVSESLRLSGHSKGPHGYGAIWGGKQASFHHNLLAHHDSRTPRLGPGVKHAGTDTVDMVNNVFYNWNGNGCYGGEAMHVNIVNNYYKAGPATEDRIANQVVAINASNGQGSFKKIKDKWGKFYINGNYFPKNREISAENWKGVKIVGSKPIEDIRLTLPLNILNEIYIDDAKTAYDRVLVYAGCCLHRDDVDNRIIAETKRNNANFKGRSERNGQGGIWKSKHYPRSGLIDSQQDLNVNPRNLSWTAWPKLKETMNTSDSDLDGIPDKWLQKHAAGKKATDRNEEGYTVLEQYLDSIVDIISVAKNGR